MGHSAYWFPMVCNDDDDDDDVFFFQTTTQEMVARKHIQKKNQVLDKLD